MEQTQYLVVGSSHAALEAISAIRQHDAQGSLTVVTRDCELPYSPTLLPHIVSGRTAPQRAFLRDRHYFAQQRISYRSAQTLVRLHPERNTAVLADGTQVGYAKALLATGAAPAIPPIRGIDQVNYHVLRTLDDARKLQRALADSHRAVVLGGGLVGMHAAENLAQAGADVTIVEQQQQVLGGYFDPCAARFIERAFAASGVRIRTGQRVVGLAPGNGRTSVLLDNDDRLEADLLMVATGVKPQLDYLEGSGVEHAEGIFVDESMRTNLGNVWAAGDCAQAKNFFGNAASCNAVLPDAAEQGRIAGMAMAGDPGRPCYGGGVALNTYRFFGALAISVGEATVPHGAVVRSRVDEADGRYLRAVLQDGRLLGILSIGEFFDAGVMLQLIRRRVDLSDSIERLLADPLATGRALMSRLWR